MNIIKVNYIYALKCHNEIHHFVQFVDARKNLDNREDISRNMQNLLSHGLQCH
jgi:hypothetical protein